MHREQPKKRISPFHVGDMQRISIGKHGQAVAFPQFLQKALFENRGRLQGAVPGLDELFKVKLAAEPPGQMQVPILWGDAALLPVFPERIVLDGRPDLLRGAR